jgi:hypothetical protein
MVNARRRGETADAIIVGCKTTLRQKIPAVRRFTHWTSRARQNRRQKTGLYSATRSSYCAPLETESKRAKNRFEKSSAKL